MTPLDDIERTAKLLAPEGTQVGGSQTDRIRQYLGAAVRARRLDRPPSFIPGTGRLGGQHHEHDESPPVDPRQGLAAARAALHAPQEMNP